ncbi:MAG: quinone oxidoreductase [Rhodobiaceae bacterium]|nr:quinone oxidoreductase [Rhodobiaceae bacterium]
MGYGIRIHKHGGPEVLRWEEVAPLHPAAGEVLVRHQAIGLNFIDTYFRTGLYKPPALPFIPGNEGAGIVAEVGKGVTAVKPGDRIAYAGTLGSYAQERLLPADRVVKVPRGVSAELAASIMLKGMTAHYLLHRVHKVKAGDTVLCHAAAGAVGQILCQWANALGATVIGTVGSAEKAKIAKKRGCHHVINYREKDFAAEVLRITRGAKVDVVYDGVGKDVYPASLDCIRPLGLWALFGQSSGPVPPVDLSILAQKGSLFVTRPILFTYIAARKDLEKAARQLFRVVTDGTVNAEVNQRYALKDAAQAHRDLEARRTTGATVLLP